VPLSKDCNLTRKICESDSHYVYTWIRLDTSGYAWIRLDTLGYVWIHLDTLGYTWIRLDTLGYYCIPLALTPRRSNAPAASPHEKIAFNTPHEGNVRFGGDEGNVRQRPHEGIFLLTSGARWFKVIPTTDEERIKCQHEMITVS
jgi:hypothetical protein